MQTLTFTYSATGPHAPAHRRTRVGVVASGDLEILATPRADGQTSIQITTSVEGYDEIWRAVLDGFIADGPFGADLVINDAGATPGTVALRLAQLREAAAA